jgi:hypothetical protein
MARWRRRTSTDVCFLLVFNKCADSVEQGRRLENLSWRLWQREQFCCDEKNCLENSSDNNNSVTPSPTTQLPPRSIPSATRIQDDVPHLSSSVESTPDEEAVEFSSVSLPLDISRPMIRRQDSTASTRSRRERHITADDFEKMVSSIINTKEAIPLSAPEPARPIVCQPTPIVVDEMANAGSSTLTDDSEAIVHSLVDLSSPHMTPRTQIVHGFSPSQVHVAISPPAPEPVSATITDIPAPDAAPAAKNIQPKKQAKFALGGSCSSSEPDSLRPVMASRSGSLLSAMRKQACFSNQILTCTYDADEAAIDSDTDDDELDESAIEDDESSDWEDSVEESGRSSIDDAVFKRDNSKVHLPSRPSLITLMIENNERAYGIASQSTTALHRLRSPGPKVAPSSSPNDSDDGGLVMKRAGRPSPLGPINETTRTKAQPIVASHYNTMAPPNCLSPRTTRNHMVQAELTASLRVGIVHARKQNGLGLQRRHTSHDVATLKQFPEKSCLKKEEDQNASSLSQYFLQDTSNGYHDRGW